MNNHLITRRLILKMSTAFSAQAIGRTNISAFIAISQSSCSANKNKSPFINISHYEAQQIKAIAARILPTTDTPGATEAGAVYFFDHAFGNIFLDAAPYARKLLQKFQKPIPKRYPGAQYFSDLNELDQDKYLKTVETTPFFEGARLLTLAGVFGMAKYGGNKNLIGWKLVGLPGPPQAWIHPFGDY